MTPAVDVVWLVGELDDRSAHGIAHRIMGLIRAGVLPIGIRLPTVRDLAFRLGVSPATVSGAWARLRRQNVVSGRGRLGSWVCGDSAAPRPNRKTSVARPSRGMLDLAAFTPDPALLPPLQDALTRAAAAEGVNGYANLPILPRLQRTVERFWPYRAPAFLATNGGFTALYEILHVLISPGDLVAIEEPATMRILDIIEYLGGSVVPVACDRDGPIPAALQAALDRRPAAFLFQPRTHAVTGVSIPPGRLAALCDVLDGGSIPIIEDDALGGLSPIMPASLGAAFPDRVIHAFSVSKSISPELRLAVVSGPAAVIEKIHTFRGFSVGWTSHVLQSAASWLLADPDACRIVREARRIYAQRRTTLTDHLQARDMRIGSGAGLSLWIPVRSEPAALRVFEDRRMMVLPGSKCGQGRLPHIRLAFGRLKDNQAAVADAIRDAAA